ncbi:MAG TPA: DUF4198 domain-containing protein [Gammaproteobacteria bacterium]|nr:DUF4198 domain-containing protein [Gammaproteobacteria bacterium]
MSIRLSIFAGLSLLSIIYSPTLSAHFQLLYTSDLVLKKSTDITLKMPFSHPATLGAMMEMPKPEAFTVLHRGQQKNLLSNVKPIQWTSGDTKATAYEAAFKIKSMGDYVFSLTPTPYFEESEALYIQQFTKTIINNAGLPTDWNTETGAKAEIVPLNKPYAVLKGGTFSGIVKYQGEPVPFANIEIEYLNYTPITQSNRFADKTAGQVPEPFAVHTLIADANGTFVFGIPIAGTWGFAAIDLDETARYNGKRLSIDAVIWIQAHDVPLRGK